MVQYGKEKCKSEENYAWINQQGMSQILVAW